MNVLGIDPGTSKNNFGWAVVSDKGYIASGILYLKFGNFEDKLLTIGNHILTLINKYKITLIAVESYFSFGRAKGAQRIHELRGVLQYLAAANSISFINVAPTTVKKRIAGYGRADKLQVANAVAERLKLDLTGKSDHETDALAIALVGPSVNIKKIVG